MIAHLRGRLISKTPNQAVVEAGGVGYDVTITIPTFGGLPEAGAEVCLHIHTHVREDAIALFGFRQASEKQLFEKLISVSGIGPKLAITILSGIEAQNVVAALRGNDLAALTRVPGIGKKTAERLILELRDKLEDFGTAAPATRAQTPTEDDVLSALVNLGYQRLAAERAVLQASGNGKNRDFNTLFRESLALMSK